MLSPRSSLLLLLIIGASFACKARTFNASSAKDAPAEGASVPVNAQAFLASLQSVEGVSAVTDLKDQTCFQNNMAIDVIIPAPHDPSAAGASTRDVYTVFLNIVTPSRNKDLNQALMAQACRFLQDSYDAQGVIAEGCSTKKTKGTSVFFQSGRAASKTDCGFALKASVLNAPQYTVRIALGNGTLALEEAGKEAHFLFDSHAYLLSQQGLVMPKALKDIQQAPLEDTSDWTLYKMKLLEAIEAVARPEDVWTLDLSRRGLTGQQASELFLKDAGADREKRVARFPNLRRLHLAKNALENVEFLEVLPLLEELVLDDNPALGEHPGNFRFLAKAPALAKLSLENVGLQPHLGTAYPNGLGGLSSEGLPNLRTVSLSRNTQLATLGKLAFSDTLEDLALAQTAVASKGIFELQALPALRNLDLSRMALPPPYVAALAKALAEGSLPQLVSVHLSETATACAVNQPSKIPFRVCAQKGWVERTQADRWQDALNQLNRPLFYLPWEKRR